MCDGCVVKKVMYMYVHVFHTLAEKFRVRAINYQVM